MEPRKRGARIHDARETELENGGVEQQQRSAKGPGRRNPSEKAVERRRRPGEGRGGRREMENTQGEKGIHRDG